MPRINRVIELWEAGQPIYHAGAGELTYENGKKQAGTWADYLEVDFENAPFDTVGLLAFMRGLVDGGPTRSGHRTPTVITTLPANCRTREEMLANAWQARAVLSCGVHGILHTHCRQASAVQAFVEACRYPFQTIGIGKGLSQGQRGAGGQRSPAETWGISPEEYLRRADPWPLNPEGELVLALKLEDRECLANCEDITAVPGIAFGEWGPGDMGMAFGYADAHDPPYPPEMMDAGTKIFAAHRKNGLRFRTGWREPGMPEDQRAKKLIDEGVMDVGVGEEGAKWGRAYTRREMPV